MHWYNECLAWQTGLFPCLKHQLCTTKEGREYTKYIAILKKENIFIRARGLTRKHAFWAYSVANTVKKYCTPRMSVTVRQLNQYMLPFLYCAWFCAVSDDNIHTHIVATACPARKPWINFMVNTRQRRHWANTGVTFDPLTAAGTTNNSPSSDWSNEERIDMTSDGSRQLFLHLYFITLNNIIEIGVRLCLGFVFAICTKQCCFLYVNRLSRRAPHVRPAYSV